jgi:hemin uptake protein HemP
MNELSITLLDFLKTKEIQKEDSTANALLNKKGSSEHVTVIKLDNVSNLKVYEYNSILGFDQLVKIEHDGNTYYLEEQGKIILTQLLREIPKSVKDICSLEAIELQIYYWLIDVKISNKISLELSAFLEIEIEKLKKRCNVEFPITNLHIETSFSIGNVIFDYYTKEKFIEIWNETPSPKGTLDEFLNTVSKFFGRVYASYSIYAEHDKSIDIAFEKVSFAIDVLKLFTPVIGHSDTVCVIDLDRRLNYNLSSETIVISEKNLTLNFSAKNNPLFFSQNDLKHAKEYGLDIFSNFLLASPPSDLRNLLYYSIQLFANAVSTENLYLRSILLISCIECVLLKDSYEGQMTKKVKTRFIKLILKHAPLNGKKKVEDSLEHVYNLRHDTIHKGIKSPIDYIEYSKIQFFIRLMLIIIIQKYLYHYRKEDLIDEIDSFKTSN